MENKAWFFGDSFTAGWEQSNIDIGLFTGQEEYFVNFLNGNGKRWTEIVAENFNCQHMNLGKGGSCNEDILFSIIDNLQFIKPGDTVIISNSHELRFQIPKYDGEQIITFNSGRIQEVGLQDYHRDFVKDEKFLKTTLVDYAYETRYKHSMLWRNYFLKRFEKLQHYFLSNNIRPYFWHFDMWMYDSQPYMWHRIAEHTNGKIQDIHFSQLGHEKFSEYFLNNLDLFKLKLL